MKLNELISFDNSIHKDFLSSKDAHWELIYDIDPYLDRLFTNPPQGYKVENNLLIGEGAEIDSRLKVVGRAVIGPGTTVGDGVLFRDGVVVGENCNIGHGSEIKHSIILGNSRVAHLNYVGDSLIGNDVNLAAGVIIANFKNGSRNLEVSVNIDGQKVNTGFQKLGALIGDSSALGSNCVTDPGAIIGKNCLIYPLTSIRGTIENNKIVKNKPNLEIVNKE